MSSSAANAAPRTFMRLPTRIVRRYSRAFRSMKRMVSPSRRRAASIASPGRPSGCPLDSGMRHRLRASASDLGDQSTVAAELARGGHAAPLALAEVGGLGRAGEERVTALQEVGHEARACSPASGPRGGSRGLCTGAGSRRGCSGTPRRRSRCRGGTRTSRSRTRSSGRAASPCGRSARAWVQHRLLLREVGQLPVHDVAEQPRRLVVEVVPGREHREPCP